MMKHLMVVLMCCVAVTVVAGQAPSNVAMKKVVVRFEDVKFTIEYPRKMGCVKNIVRKVPLERFEGSGFEERVVLESRLTADTPPYTIAVSTWASFDPKFSLYQKGNDGRDKEIAEYWGTTLKFYGDGFLYVSGHTNDMFDKASVFKRVGNEFQKVRQDFDYAGLETKTKQKITLFVDENQTERFRDIEIGEPICVVLRKGEDSYLIRTKERVLGWYKYPQTPDIQKDNIIAGFFHYGD